MGAGTADGTDASASLAAALARRLPELSDELLARLLDAIPELRGDEAVRELLATSVRASIATGIDVLAHDIDVGAVESPAAASEYARRLAQRGVPVEALLRAYRIGHQRFLEWCLAAAAAQGGSAADAVAALDRITRVTFRFIDRVSEQLLAVYADERERWLRSASAARAALVRQLLGDAPGDPDQAEARLGYRLRGWHVAVTAWLDPATPTAEALPRLDRLGAALAGWPGGTPLTVLGDERSLWAWLPVSGERAVTADELAAVVDPAAHGASLAIGLPAEGPEGFAVSHRQALRAQAVGAAAEPAVGTITPFADASLLAFLTGDVPAARGWIAQMLGGLVGPEEPAARLRETVRVFLGTNGSYTETAARLHLHKNTVLYRVRKAEELRGRPLDEDRIGLEVALLACDRLGAAVLGGDDGSGSRSS
ncbi:PucR family transcriptional regulator [Patulibacter defluvii]|uniref:PucR family transcriptional regulator n=1 Tax=Patulibacter defluvii TaxID=3095358 RepID=UPI002A75170C|nr:helix-turn-helix domain-containing protein [Patulibacter sp. DM4]